jgi:hypothetical protein
VPNRATPDNRALQRRAAHRATAAHRFFDFTHREYSPRAPVVGKWCSRVLLEHSFELAPDSPVLAAAAAAASSRS